MPEGIKKSSPKQKTRWGIITGVAITLAFCLLYILGWLEGFELWSYNSRFRIRGELPVRDDIVLVTKDEESKNVLGKRGADFTRCYFGAMFRNLADAGADVVGIDFEFSKPVFQDPLQDRCMIDALYYAGNIILARFISRGTAVKPYQPFREVELGEGLINFTNVDPDRVFRRVQMVEVDLDKQEAFFTLGMEMVKHRFYEYGVSELEETEAESVPGGIKREEMPALELYTEGEKEFPRAYFRFGRFVLPENMLINYVGPGRSYPSIPFWRIKEGEFDPKEVEGKMVLVGTTLVADHDYYLTPFPSRAEVEEKGGVEIETREAGLTAGVEIHANIIQTILDGNFITRWKEAEIIGLI
ncbi:MAG: CHASE2 domain-containing protein, partial [Deltaproteobacteria bacterium]